MGASSKLTVERRDRICEALLAGASVQLACSRGKIHHDTHYQWLHRGEAALVAADHDLAKVPEAERHYSEYSEAVTYARDAWELSQVALVQRAAVAEPYKRTRETVKYDKQGKVTERTVVTEEGVDRGDWRAAFELLRARKPQEYGRLTRTLEITGKDDGPIEVATPEEIAERARAKVIELAARRERRVEMSQAAVAVTQIAELLD